MSSRCGITRMGLGRNTNPAGRFACWRTPTTIAKPIAASSSLKILVFPLQSRRGMEACHWNLQHQSHPAASDLCAVSESLSWFPASAGGRKHLRPRGDVAHLPDLGTGDASKPPGTIGPLLGGGRAWLYRLTRLPGR